ncbi:MAG: hypothetical protein E6G66_16480 [Actinobacteria bacterium]|nr:MAG: hypothetical protein E6G66_16480 [Actinomycetota bacterium]
MDGESVPSQLVRGIGKGSVPVDVSANERDGELLWQIVEKRRIISVKIRGDAPREQGFAQALIAEIDLPPHGAAITELAIDAVGRDVGHEGLDVFSGLLTKRDHEREGAPLSPDVARYHEEPQPVQLDVRGRRPGDVVAPPQQIHGIRNTGMVYRRENPLDGGNREVMQFGDFP